MKLSLNWIKDYVALDTLDPSDVMTRVTTSTAEVEGVECINRHFAQVITARVLELRPHPNADKLKLVRVNDGLGEIEVVCGAPNVAKGQIVALARAGALLPKGKLEASSIRGIRSEGMLCAEDELGLSDDHAGLLLFPSETPIGLTLDKLYGGEDIVFEVENKSLTHRPDLWGHFGFAREFSAIYGKALRGDLFRYERQAPVAPLDPLRIENLAPELCPRYTALVVRKVAVAPSPIWMQQRLRAVGLRPINNLVDVTNYVMLELAQPMHAFDRRQIAGDLIRVRRAENGEPFTTLDKQEHTLTPENLVIADASRPVALGGVMGGLDSEIVPDTTCIVLESANFHPACIRRTATRFALRTESAQRFEKSQDPAVTATAIWRAVELLRLTCPELEIAGELLDSWPNPPKPVEIEIDFDYINEHLGERLPEERIVEILRSLHFGVKVLGGKALLIAVPSYRATKDVGIKADIVEEIGRIFGYDNIQPTPPKVFSDPPEHNLLRELEWRLKDILVQRLAFCETYNPSFLDGPALERCGLTSEGTLKLRNPLSVEADRMRTTLVPHIVADVAKNRRNFESIRLFELGKAIYKADPASRELPTETPRLCGAIAKQGDEAPFFAAKGAVGELLDVLGYPKWRLERPALVPGWAHPGRVAEVFVGERSLGLIGELHPRVADAHELTLRVALFDLNVLSLFELPPPERSFTPLRRFPVNAIELTVVMDKRQSVAAVEACIKAAGGAFLLSYSYLYGYEGERLAADKKAVTYSVVFGLPDRTLSGDEVAELHKSTTAALRLAGFPLRGEENA